MQQNRPTGATEVAKLTREFISAEKKKGTIPKEMKISVTKDHYRAINVELMTIPEELPLFDEKSCKFIGPGRTIASFRCEYHPKIKEVLSKLKGFDEKYNYDNSDPLTDYVAVGHFYQLKVNRDLERTQETVLFEKLKNQI